jgi:hypothetical protein
MSRSFERWRWLLLASVCWIAACASSGSLRSVESDHWKSVPPAWREKIERVHAALIAGAMEERRKAAAAVEDARRALNQRNGVQAPPTAAVPEGDPAWQEAWKAYERAQADARGKIAASQEAFLKASLRWRERRLDAAEEHLRLVRAGFELAKAVTVMTYTPDDKEYDVDEYRGQFARLHRSWSEALRRAAAARAEADEHSRALASAKEAYARLRREGPTPPPAAQQAAQIQAQTMRQKWLFPHPHPF